MYEMHALQPQVVREGNGNGDGAACGRESKRSAFSWLASCTRARSDDNPLPSSPSPPLPPSPPLFLRPYHRTPDYSSSTTSAPASMSRTQSSIGGSTAAEAGESQGGAGGREVVCDGESMANPGSGRSDWCYSQTDLQIR